MQAAHPPATFQNGTAHLEETPENCNTVLVLSNHVLHKMFQCYLSLCCSVCAVKYLCM